MKKAGAYILVLLCFIIFSANFVSAIQCGNDCYEFRYASYRYTVYKQVGCNGTWYQLINGDSSRYSAYYWDICCGTDLYWITDFDYLAKSVEGRSDSAKYNVVLIYSKSACDSNNNYSDFYVSPQEGTPYQDQRSVLYKFRSHDYAQYNLNSAIYWGYVGTYTPTFNFCSTGEFCWSIDQAHIYSTHKCSSSGSSSTFSAPYSYSTYYCPSFQCNSGDCCNVYNSSAKYEADQFTNKFKSSSTVCRASAGDCDAEETCTGSSSTCPTDVFNSSSTVCRGSAGICDIAEKCTGSLSTCPADAKSPILPGVNETCGNGIDDNCNGQIDEGCPVVSALSWSDLLGNSISTAELGDSLRMLVHGTNLENREINYTVKKETAILFGLFKIYTTISELKSELWTANTIGNNIYFKINVAAGGTENISNYMDISSIENNAMPVANIILPVDGYLAAVNNSINFTQSSYDKDDLLNITWDFGDGITQSFANYSLYPNRASADTTHSYISGGKWYTVTLTAAEMTRSQSSSATKTIYIFQPGMNVVPVITSPPKGSAQGNIVKFNASQSFVANCSSTMAGANFTAGNLQCKYIHAPNTKNIAGKNYELVVNWAIKTDGALSLSIQGNWGSGYNDVVDFAAFMPYSGSHIADLNIKYIEK